MCPNLYCISIPSHVPRISLLSCLDLYFSEHMFTCVNITNEPHLRQILNLNKPRITYSTAWCSHCLANLSNICENMDPVKTVYQKITSLSRTNLQLPLRWWSDGNVYLLVTRLRLWHFSLYSWHKLHFYKKIKRCKIVF